jgi:hypothetical protein
VSTRIDQAIEGVIEAVPVMLKGEARRRVRELVDAVLEEAREANRGG